jgi:selenoprotein W-related protein
LADELLSGWAPVIAGLELVSSTKGRFEVTVDGELVFSKAELGRHARAGEVASLVRNRIGPEVLRK